MTGEERRQGPVTPLEENTFTAAAKVYSPLQGKANSRPAADDVVHLQLSEI
jgi:hypothetical protein